MKNKENSKTIIEMYEEIMNSGNPLRVIKEYSSSSKIEDKSPLRIINNLVEYSENKKLYRD